MNKVRLKKEIANVCKFVGMASAMTCITIMFLFRAIDEGGLWWIFAVGDTLVTCGDWYEAINTWKDIKIMLEEEPE